MSEDDWLESAYEDRFEPTSSAVSLSSYAAMYEDNEVFESDIDPEENDIDNWTGEPQGLVHGPWMTGNN